MIGLLTLLNEYFVGGQITMSKTEIKDEKKKEFLYQTLQNISGIKLKLETQCEENWGNFKHLTSRRDAEGYTNNSKTIKKLLI